MQNKHKIILMENVNLHRDIKHIVLKFRVIALAHCCSVKGLPVGVMYF